MIYPRTNELSVIKVVLNALLNAAPRYVWLKIVDRHLFEGKHVKSTYEQMMKSV